MKRILTFATLLLSLQIVTAHSLPAADLSVKNGDQIKNTFRDTIVALPVGAYSGSIFKLRLDSIQKEVQLDYNEYVQGYIDIYTRHKDEMNHVLALSKYYFPIYEKIFEEAGIPTEIKYLSIVESKLDPGAVSRVGATGPWQFMSTTAKIYGLNMDSYVDDRRDPIKASYAAAAYLKDAYQEFGDWLLAIASYNCGKSNVERAIEKANAMDFWSIRQYLPLETRGYVPAYIAMSYVMNYARKHDIAPDGWKPSFKTDTVMVDRFIELNNVAKALAINVTDITILNSAYKRQIINGTPASPRKLIIPKANHQNYTALYSVLNGLPMPAFIPQQPAPIPTPVTVPVATVAYVATAPAAPVVLKQVGTKTPDYHLVKDGDTLENIAQLYGLDVREIKAWNHLPNGKVIAGKKVRLNPFAKESRG